MIRRKYTRKELAEKAALTGRDLAEVKRRRRPHNRLGSAYQVGFVKLFSRFPAQQPLEILDDLLAFTGVHLGNPVRTNNPKP
ncbi:MAG: DUF4158 domain-containing protein [Gemmatimonadetes bacterium]|nr:DUF4158 domain-containing protein [Gemmatimonadota bacterium]